MRGGGGDRCRSMEGANLLVEDVKQVVVGVTEGGKLSSVVHECVYEESEVVKKEEAKMEKPSSELSEDASVRVDM